LKFKNSNRYHQIATKWGKSFCKFYYLIKKNGTKVIRKLLKNNKKQKSKSKLRSRPFQGTIQVLTNCCRGVSAPSLSLQHSLYPKRKCPI